jgi:cysteinyl-tRNA synthetase
MTLGLLSDTSDAYFRYGIEEKLKKKGISIDTVLDRIREREEARALHNYERSDRIRDELTEWGMILEDTRFGTFWKFADDDM